MNKRVQAVFRMTASVLVLLVCFVVMSVDMQAQNPKGKERRGRVLPPDSLAKMKGMPAQAFPAGYRDTVKVPGIDTLRIGASDTPGVRGKTVNMAEKDTLPSVSPADNMSATDSLSASRLNALNDSVFSETRKDRKRAVRPRFVPDPKKALWISLVLPGGGQIYNRKYWKLPFVYGGFLGCTYALMWNQQMYRDYSQAYLDIMDDDPNTKSYMDMLPPRYDITGKEEQFKALFKRKKDFYRRYRDLSAFCFVGVYLLSVIDAYVDAQLSEFDISPDLSLRVEPAVIPGGTSSRGGNAYGVGCSLSF